ncbi:glycosyltransferase [Arhodomonas sp. AD133]|uniref:glycosyltransferase n=1 Tax=Arhodomonas sp. AD133 TaxID=3415009 RepID=UPI003EBB947B
MRVLHIGKYFPPFNGGIENFMADLVLATTPLGVDVSAVVHHSPDAPKHVTREHWHGTAIHRVPSYGQIAYAPISPAFPWALRRAISTERPDVLHVHMPNTSAFWLLGLPAARRLPWVVHWHADVVGPGMEEKLRRLYPFYRPLEQTLLRRADAIVATSPDYLSSSEALARWRSKAEVIPLGLPLERVSADADGMPWQYPERLKVLCVGRLSKYKGIDRLIEAAERVSGLEVVVVGDGEEKPSLQALAQGGDGRSSIRLAGRVTDAERNALMASCDVLCLPSLNRAEAFGVVLLEAMALGRPAIVSRVPGSGMSWVVRDGETGWHVPPGDSAALAERLALLRDQPELLAPAGRAARARFDAEFRIDRIAAQVSALYRTLA